MSFLVPDCGLHCDLCRVLRFGPYTAHTTMKLNILSDLHTEFADFVPPDTDADAVILAGDIGVGVDGVRWAARRYPLRPVIYVPGNHEFYGHDIGMTAELEAAAPDNITVLSDGVLVLDGVRFLGSTLWTDFKLQGEGEAWFARERARLSMADFVRIRQDGRRFRPKDSAILHEASRTWLVSQLGQAFDGPTVVITHHLPASTSIAKRYASDPLSPAFASRLEGLIEKYQPALWIHGHTHDACNYELFRTRIVCNPRGYPGEYGNAGFRPDLTVVVPGS
ncbi:MAG: metallophosphoesterase [Woeseiaceae bacterium]|nr:metallophosphoesterase [Woeseiaceae bacterium]